MNDSGGIEDRGFNFERLDRRQAEAAAKPPQGSPEESQELGTTQAADAALAEEITESAKQEASLSWPAKMILNASVTAALVGAGLFRIALSQQSMEGAIVSAVIVGVGVIAATAASMTAEGVGEP